MRQPVEFSPSNLALLMRPHGLSCYGNCWRLVEDQVGYSLFRNNYLYLRYASRINVFRDIFLDISNETVIGTPALENSQ